MGVVITDKAEEYVFKVDIRDPVSAGVANLTDDPALSLTAYWSQPMDTVSHVKFRYGTYLVVKGPSPDGKGIVLNAKTPPLMLPGVTLRPIATCVAYHTGVSIVIEGTEVFLTDKLAETITSFALRVEMSWTDTPDKQEVHFRGSIRLGLDLSDYARALLPKSLFEKIGTAAVKGAMDIMARSFARSFAEDYDKWANDESYRKVRASTKAVPV